MKSNRRDFLKNAAMFGGMAGLLGQSGCAMFGDPVLSSGKSMIGFRAPPTGDKVRIGLLGLGNRGSGAIKRLSSLPNTEIVAVGDLLEERVDKQVKVLTGKGKAAPQRFFGSKDAWKKLCESKDIDLIYICTPWLWHAPMAVYAMQCGKHAATEVPAAVTLEQCWELVKTSEETRRHCMLLENCCYGFNELLALNMCRQGVLGELIHGEAAYIHDLRDGKLNRTKYQEQWRLEWSKQHTGNPYPTHGLGPICQYMDINRGDRFEYLSSISSKQIGLTLGAEKMYGKGSVEAKTPYKLGDMSTTVIKTWRGRTIMMQHDTTSPRPYTRHNLISGTDGIVADYPLRVALRPKTHQWMSDAELEEVKAKYVHPLWDKQGESAKKMGGHGGMDALMDMRLCHCLQNGLPLDINVYDTALWSAMVELTERSTLRNGASIAIPDFTRGGWKTAEPLGIVTL